MAGAANPQKYPLGEHGNTRGSTAPGKGRGEWSTWELLWEDTEQSDPLGMAWMDPCRAGILPSASGCSSPSKHGEDSQESTILETSFDSHDSQQVLLPSPPVFQGLLPASGMVYCWITQSPTLDSRHYRSVFTRFIERISFKKRQPGGLGFGWLVVMVWTLEFDSEVLKFRVDQKK